MFYLSRNLTHLLFCFTILFYYCCKIINNNKWIISSLSLSIDVSVSYRGSHYSDTEQDSDVEDDTVPLLKGDVTPQFDAPKVYHPFVKLLLAFWPFGESFKRLSIVGKIYETVKVYDLIVVWPLTFSHVTINLVIFDLLVMWPLLSVLYCVYIDTSWVFINPYRTSYW